MKTQICILKLEDWKFKNQQGQELSGKSAIFLLEELEQQRATVKDEILNTISKTTLPAVFEADISVSQRFNNETKRATLRYELKGIKLINSLKIFN